MPNQKELKKGTRQKIIIVALIVLVVALAVCIVLLLNKPDDKLERNFVDRDNAEKIMEDMSDEVAEGMFECNMTTTWTFEDSESASPNAYVANVENNKYTICFDVYEKETNEVLYSSPFIPVGEEIDNIKLDAKLEAGDYDAVVMYTLVDENNEEVSSAGFEITISILN